MLSSYKSSRSLSHLLMSSCLSLAVEALQGKMCQNSLPSGGGRSLGAKFLGGKGGLWGIFFWFLQN